MSLNKESIDSIISESKLLNLLHSHFDGLFFPSVGIYQFNQEFLIHNSDSTKIEIFYKSDIPIIKELFKDISKSDKKCILLSSLITQNMQTPNSNTNSNSMISSSSKNKYQIEIKSFSKLQKKISS